ISTSVLIGSLIRNASCEWRSANGGEGNPAYYSPFAVRHLRLPLGRAHHQPFELGGDLDLAGQARVRPHVVSDVGHVLLQRRGVAARRAPRFVDVEGAGGAGAGAAALRLDAGNSVLDRRLHDGRADLALDRSGGALEIDIGDFRHATGAVVRVR